MENNKPKAIDVLAELDDLSNTLQIRGMDGESAMKEAISILHNKYK